MGLETGDVRRRFFRELCAKLTNPINGGIGKGCDIGYALAASSCEGAHSVEACTVTALDAITAFAVPNPNSSSQRRSVFSGLVARRVTPSS